MRLTAVKWIDSIIGGILIVMIKPAVFLLGKLLHRDHDPRVKGDLCFIKLLGGGSLVIALPSLLGLKKRYPRAITTLITTPPARPFAETLGVFDRIIVIDDRSVLRVLFTGVKAIVRSLKTDTVIDLEVHSKLATLFSMLTCARNRIGFFLSSPFWGQKLYTHLIFFNRYAGSFVFYDQVAYLLEAEPTPVDTASRHLIARIPAAPKDPKQQRICIGAGCSQLGQERMLTPGQWRKIFRQRRIETKQAEVLFLGGAGDRSISAAIINGLQPDFRKVLFRNLCGKMALAESLAVLRSADEYWGIDSALLHYARLFGVANLSLWGPTSPDTRLKPFPGLEETVRYEKMACSPCIHMVGTPPCRGDNICIEALFDPAIKERADISNVIGIC